MRILRKLAEFVERDCRLAFEDGYRFGVQEATKMISAVSMGNTNLLVQPRVVKRQQKKPSGTNQDKRSSSGRGLEGEENTQVSVDKKVVSLHVNYPRPSIHDKAGVYKRIKSGGVESVQLLAVKETKKEIKNVNARPNETKQGRVFEAQAASG
ncbi:hypothetical protein NDN08_001474 [Rhodosorus marinus]|uniref:Uncharacterized protein n=1 Tax=Rhodosorus marinus TaxID=101924 RepID=A0AAV8UV39_9RHOD|nr:hypothetical protein NDN08_001474 [Rhodosorus marinus]